MIDCEAEHIRAALRKLSALDRHPSRAFEALGYLLKTIELQEFAAPRREAVEAKKGTGS